jgi:hypothetical protein
MTKLEIAERNNMRAYNAWDMHYTKYLKAEERFQARCGHYRRQEKAYKAWNKTLAALDKLKREERDREENT